LTTDDSSCSCPAEVLSAVSKLTKLVEHHPQFHSKLEGMLQDVYNKLELEVSVSIRKEENEDSCPIFKLSNDELKHGVSYRFQQVYSKTFVGQTSTSIECAVESVSRALQSSKCAVLSSSK
jgi:hypothetical protein